MSTATMQENWDVHTSENSFGTW